MFSRVRLNVERASANKLIKIAHLLYFRFEEPQAIPHWPKVIANSHKLPDLMRSLLKFAGSLKFKRAGKGTVFTEFSVVTH